jgi:LPPG:FO 2-phospho-L-lactate transferase
MNPKSAVALAGGVGAARFLEGLTHVVPQERITIIGNVGDDKEVYGLHVSPDLDIVAYTLAGLVDADKGWGYSDDTFACQDMLERYGYETWFNLGDRDLATHIYRTSQLRLGKSLSEVSEEITRHLGLRVRLLPATDDRLETYVITKEGRMHFQEYMVRLQTKPRVYGVRFLGARSAKPAKHVMESIAEAKGIIVSPSNPIVSIGAILAVPRIRGALQRTNAKVVAISPIVGGKTIKGPADKLMKALGVTPSALGVARLYRDFLDTLIIDCVDRDLASDIQNLGIKAVVTNTLMKTISDKVRLAKVAVSEFER